MQRIRTCLLLAGVLGAAGAATSAHAHVHGMAQLDVVVEGARIALALHGAGDNFVGFEHAARTPEQVTTVQAAERRLASLDGLLRIGTGCRRDSVQVTLPVNLRDAREGKVPDTAREDVGQVHGDHEHRGHDHHDHDHDHENESASSKRHPSDWWIEAEFICAGSTSGLLLDTRPLFDAFPRLQELRVQAVGASGQGGGTLKPDTATLALP